MADITETIAVRLSPETMARLDSVAARKNASRDKVVDKLLTLALPLIEEDATAELYRRVKELSGLDAVQLRSKIIAEMEPKDKRRMSRLLQLNRERVLTTSERAQLEVMQDKGMDVAVTRIAAMWLLDRRKKMKTP